MSDDSKISVLFVCLGNICRSPMAEGVFLDLLRQRGLSDRFEVDSAGTGAWHMGELPDPRMREVARRNQLELTSRARQIEPRDWERFAHIVVMDAHNQADVLAAGAPPERVRLLRSWDPEVQGDPEVQSERPPGVPDPYQGGPEGFAEVYEIILRSGRCLLDDLVE